MTINVVTCRLVDQPREQIAQFERQRGVERHQRFVKQQKVGLDRQGAGERRATGEAKRQLPRKMLGVPGKTQAFQQRLDLRPARPRRRDLDVVRDAPPGQ